jgi:dipeptidyl aminopeptidase/acylaminoacyl peptidase
LTDRRRKLGFLGLCVVALAAAVGFVAWSALADDELADRARPAEQDLSTVTSRRPFLVFQHVARDDHYAEIAIADVDEPASRTFTGLVCERVYFAAKQGLCLMPKQDALGTTAQARVFDVGFRPVRSARLGGIVSRARVSPSGRYGAATTFVSGHSYQDQGFSTSTTLIDMARGKVLANLERFAVTKDGKPFKAIDFNFWGVTFTPDDRRFYATLQSSGDIYLIEGDVDTRRARVIAKGVECPSLSPDGRRIAFKSRQGGRWRLHVLDIASGQRTALAETRSVDDQVEWLDDRRILYGLEGHVWAVPADGNGEPSIYVRDALSPAVVRS